MLKQLALCLAICSTSTSALAKSDRHYDPAMLRAVEAVNTPEKMAKVLSDTFHVALSKNWPTNFPVPVYTSNVVDTSFTHSTQGPPTAAATLITKDPPKQVFDFYQSACARANWTVKVPSAKAMAQLKISDDLYSLTADQGKQSMFLTCTRSRKTNNTMVAIEWQISSR